MIEPYKNRSIRASEDVWAYRNLMRTDGKWYSLMQRGLVVGHARAVALEGVRLVVRPAGHLRVLATGVKNVHAFVVGRLVPPSRLSWDEHGEARSGRYNPRIADSFEVVDPDTGCWGPCTRAKAALLDERGLVLLGA